MDQGSNQGQNNPQPAPNAVPQTPAGNPSMEPQQAPQPQDTVIGKTDATTYAVGSQNNEAGPKAPVDHESVADKLFAPFKKLMNAGKAPQNVASSEPDKITQEQPHVATPEPEQQPKG